jgi:hypothetical protein
VSSINVLFLVRKRTKTKMKNLGCARKASIVAKKMRRMMRKTKGRGSVAELPAGMKRKRTKMMMKRRRTKKRKRNGHAAGGHGDGVFAVAWRTIAAAGFSPMEFSA